jgi:hypothetical protein
MAPGLTTFREPATKSTSNAAVVGGAVALAALLVAGPGLSWTPTCLLLLVAYGCLVLALRGGVLLDRRLVVVLGAALLLLAVIRPPTQSHDVWSYVMYGRTVSVHHQSPYLHGPADYASDPFLARVAPIWRDAPSVYGPAFTWWSALITTVAGSSALVARLGFQLTAAVAVAICAFVVHRRRPDDASGLALLLLNPLIVISLVNDAHLDALIALALLTAVVLLEARRPVLAGVALGLGLLVKLSLGVALLGLGLWMILRRVGWRIAAAVFLTAALVVGAGYAVGGGRAALEPALNATGRVSSDSVWAPLYRSEAEPISMPGGKHHDTAAGKRISKQAGVLVLVLLAGMVWAFASEGLAVAAAAGPLAYGLAAAYVYPWYTAPVFPLLGQRRRRRFLIVALVQAASLQIASAAGRRFTVYAPARYPPEPAWHSWYRTYGNAIVQAALIAVVVAIVVRAWQAEQTRRSVAA